MSFIYKLLMCTNLVAMIHTIGNIPSTVPSIRYHKGFTISSECQCQYGFFAVHIKAVLLHQFSIKKFHLDSNVQILHISTQDQLIQIAASYIMSAKLQYRILTTIAASVLIFTQFGSAQCASSSEVTSLHNLLSGLEANINIVVSELISSYSPCKYASNYSRLQ